jgi:peptidyl-tRNA hydrolase, PTH1 family
LRIMLLHETTPMQLLVGLGNPGARYVGNRHNVGFMAVQEIAKRHGIGPWRRRFAGVACEGPIGGERVLLLLPGTYMNDSGRAVAEAAQFYKLAPGGITVFHDEIELPPSKVRVKIGGGIAGHNGLRSISEHIGNDYRRVRIGVGHPGHKDLVEHYVLSDFPKSERPWLEALIAILADNAGLLVRGQDASFQNKVHLDMLAKGFDSSGSEKNSNEPRTAD